LVANQIPVAANSLYTAIGGDTWSFIYTTGAPGVYLQSITIDLSPTDIRFNTAPGGWGSFSGTSEDITVVGNTGTTTGLTSITPNGTGLDGGSLVTFTFSNFTVGDTFTFKTDLDHPAPTLTDCSGDTGLAKIACQAANGLATLNAETVTSLELANANITFSFGGTYIVPNSVTDSLGASFFPGAQTTVSAPEPATLAMGAAGLALLLTRLRKPARRLKS
jgi:hypothetical protein